MDIKGPNVGWFLSTQRDCKRIEKREKRNEFVALLLSNENPLPPNSPHLFHFFSAS